MGLPLGKALAIGLFQCLAMIPGVSRSGATIVGALMLGVKQAGGGGVFVLSVDADDGRGRSPMISTRTVTCWISARWARSPSALSWPSSLRVLVVRWVLGYVTKHGYALFGWWRIIVGAAAWSRFCWVFEAYR